MSADLLLQRLDKVKPTGKDCWIACCPAHGDKSPSLSIREIDDRTLIHCFGGCGAIEVLEAVGLDWSALYPPRDPDTHRIKKAPRVPYADALRCIANESYVVLVCASRTEDCVPLSMTSLKRLRTAIGRITAAVEITGAWQ